MSWIHFWRLFFHLLHLFQWTLQNLLLNNWIKHQQPKTHLQPMLASTISLAQQQLLQDDFLKFGMRHFRWWEAKVQNEVMEIVVGNSFHFLSNIQLHYPRAGAYPGNTGSEAWILPGASPPCTCFLGEPIGNPHEQRQNMQNLDSELRIDLETLECCLHD